MEFIQDHDAVFAGFLLDDRSQLKELRISLLGVTVLEKTRDFRNKVKSAMVYPILVTTGMIVVTFIVMTVVVPRLTRLYKEFYI